MRRALVALLLVSAVKPVGGQQLWRNAGQQMLDEAVQIPAAEFAEPRVLDLCNAFVAANGGYRVLRYFVITDPADSPKLLGPGITDIDFQGWLSSYRVASPQPPATAELLKLGDEAVVRFRFGDGRITQRVIGTRNPLALEYAGETAKILDIAPDPPRLVMHRSYAGGEQFFVQTAHPWTLALAEAFDKFLHAATGLTSIQISIEDGWWFAGETRYPIYNRFLPHLPPPTLEEYKRHVRFYCDDLTGGCIQFGPFE